MTITLEVSYTESLTFPSQKQRPIFFSINEYMRQIFTIPVRLPACGIIAICTFYYHLGLTLIGAPTASGSVGWGASPKNSLAWSPRYAHL